MDVADWFLSTSERGNPATEVDRRHPDGAAWTSGNAVRPLVHGQTYFAELLECLGRVRAGDLVMFTDWRGDPDQRWIRPARRCRTRCAPPLRVAWSSRDWSGARTWTGSPSASSRTDTSARRSRRPAASACSTCGCGRADRITRSSSSCATPADPSSTSPSSAASTCATAGATTADHDGDPQRQPMAKVYGDRPPWHDIQLDAARSRRSPTSRPSSASGGTTRRR